MAKKVFTSESFTTLLSTIKTYVDNIAATKASSGHTHSVATTSANGLMSASDKSKLDGMVLATVSEVETYLAI